MRNLKKTNAKGFTLVELIVVMAIIGVLAAVLVPSMLGFMKDSRISTANSNAHAVLTASSSWLAKEVAANDNAGDFANANFVTGAAIVKGTTAINLTGGGGTGATDLGANNFRDKLGENFYGSIRVVCTTGGDAVKFALWQAGTATPAASANNGGQYTNAEQDAFANTAAIIGCSPLA